MLDPIGLWRRLLTAADQLDAAATAGRAPSGAAPGAWAVLKVAACALASPAIALWLGVRATDNHRRMKQLADRLPDLLDAMMGDAPHGFPLARVQRIDAGQRWFVASDLHRMPSGQLDWPTAQVSRDLYDHALDHYARDGWGLVENGDIEDYWLVGGSAYGVAYDIGRSVAAVLGGRAGRRLAQAVYGEHLRRIEVNYRGTYDRVRKDFVAPERYVRVVGNHDDPYDHHWGAELLGEVLPGAPVADFVVLESEGAPVGVVFHGHQTDAWNGPALPSRIAHFTSWFGSALHDLPLVGLSPGLPPPEATQALVAGRVANRLTRVNGLVGATVGLESLDEVRLFEAFRRRWGRPGQLDLDEGPWVILGHTHLPLAAPEHPGDGGRWRRYCNGGSGITRGAVTGVEWDGTEDPLNPQVRVVAWVGEPTRSIRRVVFAPGDTTLTVESDGPVAHAGDGSTITTDA